MIFFRNNFEILKFEKNMKLFSRNIQLFRL